MPLISVTGIRVSIMRQSVFCGVDSDVIDADDETAQTTLFVTKNSFPFRFGTLQNFFFRPNNVLCLFNATADKLTGVLAKKTKCVDVASKAYQLLNKIMWKLMLYTSIWPMFGMRHSSWMCLCWLLLLLLLLWSSRCVAFSVWCWMSCIFCA